MRLYLSVVLLVISLLAPLTVSAQKEHDRLLIVEHLHRPKKKFYYAEGDRITAYSAKHDKLVAGKLTALTDTSIFIKERELLLRDIRYIQKENAGSYLTDFVGALLIGVGTPIATYGMISQDLPEPALLPAAIVGATAGWYIVFKKPKKLGPETQYRFRMKTYK